VTTATGRPSRKAAFETVKGERQVLALSEAQVTQHLSLEELLDSLEDGFLQLELGEVQSPHRPQVTVPGKGFSLAMTAWQPGSQICMKVVNVFEANLETGLPNHLAMITLFDPQTLPSPRIALSTGQDADAWRGCSGEPAVMAGVRVAVVSAGPVRFPRRSGGFGRAAGMRPPAGVHLSCMPGQPACVGQCTAQQEPDLGVGAALFIVGPSGQGVVHGGIQPQQYAFALAHRVHLLCLPSAFPCLRSLVERAGVDDRLGGLLAAQDHEQVGHHRGLPLLVQLDDAFGLQPL
jgi:hypothetical protein